MRFFYELYDDAGAVVEEGEVLAGTMVEAQTKVDTRLSEALPGATAPTFGVFEWPEGENPEHTVQHRL